jgi:hypothetical protein
MAEPVDILDIASQAEFNASEAMKRSKAIRHASREAAAAFSQAKARHDLAAHDLYQAHNVLFSISHEESSC